MSTLSPLVVKYVSGRVRRGEITQLTARSVRNHLWSFCAVFGNRSLHLLGPRTVELWLERMEADGVAASTRAVRLSSLRGFARWLVLEDYIVRDFTLAIPRVRRPRQISRDITIRHFVACYTTCRTARERLIILLMYGCGLRCVEVSRLQVDDYDPRSRTLFLIGKAMHQRETPAPPPVQRGLAAYLAEAGHVAGPLIRSELDQHRGVTPSTVSHIVGRIVVRAGIKVRPHDGRSAHGFRAGGASDLMEQTGDAAVVVEYLGHAGFANLDRYTRRSRLEKVREAQEGRSWEPPKDEAG